MGRPGLALLLTTSEADALDRGELCASDPLAAEQVRLLRRAMTLP